MDILREIIKDPIHQQIIHQLALLYVIILKVNCRGHKLLSSYLYFVITKNNLLFKKCSSFIGILLLSPSEIAPLYKEPQRYSEMDEQWTG